MSNYEIKAVAHSSAIYRAITAKQHRARRAPSWTRISWPIANSIWVLSPTETIKGRWTRKQKLRWLSNQLKKWRISSKSNYIGRSSWRKDMAHLLASIRKLEMNIKHQIHSCKLKSSIEISRTDRWARKGKSIFHRIWTRYLTKELMPQAIDNGHIRLIFKREERRSRWMWTRQIGNPTISEKFKRQMSRRRYKMRNNTNLR